MFRLFINLYCLHLCREIDESDTYCEMTCSLPLNPEVLEKFCIPYKYVVFSPKSRCKSISYWEDLGIGYSQSVQAPFNRVLNLCHSGKNKRKQALQEGMGIMVILNLIGSLHI